MPTNNLNEEASHVIAKCLEQGIAEFVVCAGARNAALLVELERASSTTAVKVWHHFEERSAGFFAIGRMMATGLPCAVVTTSGTAAAELLPAMIEAHYQARPLVAITADRPIAHRGSGSPQAIEQENIFGVYAATDWLKWSKREPFHWNVAQEEQFSAISQVEKYEVTPFEPKAERHNVADLARWLRNEWYKGFVVLVGGLEEEEKEEVYHFCQTLRVPLIVEATSGLREALQHLILPDAERVLKESPPGKVLRLGELPSSRFWRDLENQPEIAVWSVCRNGLKGLARRSFVTKGCVSRVLRAVGDVERIDDALDHMEGSGAKFDRIEELLESYPDSEPGLVRAFSLFATCADHLFLGNSMPIREWNHFAQWSKPMGQVKANRGANGIDGQISTWLGATVDSDNAWALFGDLTAMYDLSAPYIAGQLPEKKRVMAIVNNHGGKIFERLPRLAEMPEAARKWMTNPQEIDFSGFAKMWGMSHLQVRQLEDFDALEQCEGLTLIEILPNADQTERFWKAWDQMN